MKKKLEIKYGRNPSKDIMIAIIFFIFGCLDLLIKKNGNYSLWNISVGHIYIIMSISLISEVYIKNSFYFFSSIWIFYGLGTLYFDITNFGFKSFSNGYLFIGLGFIIFTHYYFYRNHIFLSVEKNILTINKIFSNKIEIKLNDIVSINENSNVFYLNTKEDTHVIKTKYYISDISLRDLRDFLNNLNIQQIKD